MPPGCRTAVFVLAAALAAGGGTARAQSGRNILVVANDASSGSLAIAERYITARHVPPDQLVRLTTAATDQISRTEFERRIQAPIAAWLAAHSAQDRILYIVLARGIPLRVAGTAGRTGTQASVDSELAMLYRRMTGATVLPTGPIPNPYFAGNSPVDASKAFSHAAQDIYLVTRLDGFTAEDALALIDRGSTPSKDGRILLDAMPAPRDVRPATSDVRNAWLAAAASRLAAQGLAGRVVHETTSRALQNETDVLGYYSLGSNDPALAVRHPNLTFVPGALASMFLSTDARTFAEPPAAWKPGQSGQPSDYAGSTQSLTGDLIRSGATGVGGQVAEPYLDGAIRPDVLFPSYLSGFNLAESFYLATPYLSWQTIVVGDPLCAPFRTSAIAPADPDPAIDTETELPRQFSARRVAAMQGHGTPAAVKWMLRAEARSAHGDASASLDALEKAAAIDPAFMDAWRTLAAVYEQAGRYADANNAYRRQIALDHNDIVALNNLAYNLAVRDKQPDSALPLAKRAAALARNSATINDTLGWIHHLMGNDQEALRLLVPASRALPGNADVQLHAAIVLAGAGRMEEAAKALAAAGTIDPAVKDRPEYLDVQRKIGQ